METKIIPYLNGGRNLCITGCAILVRGNDLLSKAIECFSVFSHCAPIVRMDEYLGTPDRVTLIEALEHGLTLTLLSERFQGYSGQVFLFIPVGLKPEIQAKLRSEMLVQLAQGTPYDYKALFANALGHTKENAAQQFCSEAYGLALEGVGIQRKPEFQSDLAPRPGDVATWWDGELIELVGPFMTG